MTDINPKSYHLIAFEQINPLLYFYFPNFECRIFWKDLKSTLPSSVALGFRNLAINTMTFYKMGQGLDTKSGESKGSANNGNIFRIT